MALGAASSMVVILCMCVRATAPTHLKRLSSQPLIGFLPAEKEKQSMVSRSGASTPDNARRGSPRKPSRDLKLELRHKHEVQGEKIDPHLSLDEQR